MIVQNLHHDNQSAMLNILLCADAILEDVHLVWSNCRLYNTIPDSFILKACKKAEEKFKQSWSDSGLPEFMSGRSMLIEAQSKQSRRQNNSLQDGSTEFKSTEELAIEEDYVKEVDSLEPDVQLSEAEDFIQRPRKLKIIPPRLEHKIGKAENLEATQAERPKTRKRLAASLISTFFLVLFQGLFTRLKYACRS